MHTWGFLGVPLWCYPQSPVVFPFTHDSKCFNIAVIHIVRLLQERLAIAETNRQLTLEEKRLKASTVKHRANEVVERVTDRLSAVAKRTDVALQAAEERRTALNTERAERLSARGTHLNEQRERLAHMMELRYRELGEQLHARLEQVCKVLMGQ
jgi:hypothetical protein